MWSLHLSYAWLALACLGMALWHFGVSLNPSLAVHALTVGDEESGYTGAHVSHGYDADFGLGGRGCHCVSDGGELGEVGDGLVERMERLV